jgi:hypothetical protein
MTTNHHMKPIVKRVAIALVLMGILLIAWQVAFKTRNHYLNIKVGLLRSGLRD